MVDIRDFFNDNIVSAGVSKVIDDKVGELPDVYFVLVYVGNSPVSVLYNASNESIQVQDLTTFETVFSANKNALSGGYNINAGDVKLSIYVQAAYNLLKLVKRVVVEFDNKNKGS